MAADRRAARGVVARACGLEAAASRSEKGAGGGGDR